MLFKSKGIVRLVDWARYTVILCQMRFAISGFCAMQILRGVWYTHLHFTGNNYVKLIVPTVVKRLSLTLLNDDHLTSSNECDLAG